MCLFKKKKKLTIRDRKIKVKKPNYFEEFQEVQGSLLVVLGYVLMFCEESKLPCLITNIHENFSVSTSKTHPQGRAFDLSIRDWAIDDIQNCMSYVELFSNDLGAISYSDLKQRVVVHHDVGLGDHLHFQVKPL